MYLEFVVIIQFKSILCFAFSIRSLNYWRASFGRISNFNIRTNYVITSYMSFQYAMMMS